MNNSIKPLNILATINIPYVYEEGITTLEILKGVVNRLNSIIDYVNTLPTFEENVNTELSNLEKEITTQVNNLRDEINENFGTNFETSLNEAIENGTFNEMLEPLNTSIDNLNSKVSTLETNVTTLQSEILTKISDAPSDDKTYGRQNATWVEIGAGGEGISDAPVDGKLYGRENASWQEIVIPDNIMTLDTTQTITGLKTFNVTPQASNTPTNANELVNKSYVDNNLGLKTLKGSQSAPYNLRNIITGIYKCINTYVTIDSNTPILLRDGIYVVNRIPASGTINITQSDPFILTLLSDNTNDGTTGQQPRFTPYLIYVSNGATVSTTSNILAFGNVVNLSGTQRITGQKTFVSPPSTEQLPSSGNDLANKNYVDQAVLNAPTPDNMVTLDTAQTITAVKTFNNLPVSDNQAIDDNEFTNKAYVDSAISNHASEFEIKIGSLEDLDTTDKTSIVNAVNEVNENVNDLSTSVNNKVTGITSGSKITRGKSAPSGGNDGDIYFLYS